MAEAEFDLIARNFEKAAATYERAALVQNAMGAELLAVLGRTQKEHDLAPNWQQALEIGCGPGNFTELLLESLPNLKRLTLNDLSPSLVAAAQERVAGARSGDSDQGDNCPGNSCQVDSVVGDLTQGTTLTARYDLIVSNATFQWFSDLDAALTKLKALAEPGGFLVYSSFLEGTMRELAQLLGRGLNYLTAEQARTVLERHCEVLHFCTQTVVQHFDSSFHLLRHFKDTGVNNLGDKPLTPSELRRFMLRYEQRYSDESGAIALTWQPYFVVARWRD
ncbi:MAG: methyltransferase [Anaerobiospirillum sp.]|nr:methyltransferase [Anaerobiospirillum sp.]